MQDKIDRERERELARQTLKPNPDGVTVESSRQHILDPQSRPTPSKEKTEDVLKTVKQEIVGSR